RLDLSHDKVDIRAAKGPCLSLACQLAAGVVATEVVKILLGRGQVRAAPYYQQFDPFVGKLARGRLPWGNRHPWQRCKRWFVGRRLKRRGLSGDLAANEVAE
ncbi:MAG TPA: hypothetical protein VGX76_01060, partial [Pirellulales bacterium]|nr:hypothetical protein [Pirellulales bacterium]